MKNYEIILFLLINELSAIKLFKQYNWSSRGEDC